MRRWTSPAAASSRVGGSPLAIPMTMPTDREPWALRSERRHRSLLAVLAFVVCIVLPALSWLDGTGFLAWTMYSWSGSSRLSIIAVDREGSRRPIPPTSLARWVGRDESHYLVAAEGWRMRSWRGLRDELPNLGALVCRVESATAVELRLDTKRTLDAPAESTVAIVPCASPSP